MASSGRFVHNPYGYAQVLNGGSAYNACDAKGAEVARVASLGTGDYVHDTMRGRVRIHTRVKTVGIASYMAERSTHRLEKAARLMRTR